MNLGYIETSREEYSRRGGRDVQSISETTAYRVEDERRRRLTAASVSSSDEAWGRQPTSSTWTLWVISGRAFFLLFLLPSERIRLKSPIFLDDIRVKVVVYREERQGDMSLVVVAVQVELETKQPQALLAPLLYHVLVFETALSAHRIAISQLGRWTRRWALPHCKSLFTLRNLGKPGK